MARKRKTQPAAQLTELDKPAPFVPKVKEVNDQFLPKATGRPGSYDPKHHPKEARNMAKAGMSEATMAKVFGIQPSTFSYWKATYPGFSKALEWGREAMDKALEATALQRALGYSYETEKAFQTGVRMTVTETLPPNEFLLKFFLERRMPEPYRPSKEVVHTHNAGALFQEFLKRMDAAAQAKELPAPVSKVIDITPDVAPVMPTEGDGAD